MSESVYIHDVEAGHAAEQWWYPEESNLVALAPHGGEIEPYTASQANRCVVEHDIPAWVYTAESDTSTSAFNRFHVTSPKIRPQQFPLLTNVVDLAPIIAVSFHGMSKSGIKIGGRIDPSIKKLVQSKLQSVLPDDISVSCVYRGPYCGMTRQNVVNAVTLDQDGGIQIEQSMHVRKHYGDEVVDAIQSVVHSKTPTVSTQPQFW